MAVYPVIMCGGSGTRLWPASRPSRPKQFIPLIGDLSTFQDTVLRLREITGAEPPLVIAGVAQADWIRRNLAAIDAAGEILLEPEPRDSAAAVAAAAAWVLQKDPAGVLAIVAADHHVPDAAAFASAVTTAAAAAAEGWIVTLGVRPDRPSAAYGYIAPAEAVAGPVLRVSRFVEKPDEKTAEGFLKAGYLWNSGNFIASAGALAQAFTEHAPAVGEAARLGVSQAEPTPNGWRLGPAFLEAPKISFDYAVMEKSDRSAVIPVGFAWSDLGAWDAIWTASPKDEDGNAISGDANLVEVSGALVRLPPGSPWHVTLLGLSNIAVVADETDLLIADLGSSQGVKKAQERVRPKVSAPADRLAAHARNFDLWLRTAALPLWWTVGADHELGGYYDLLDHEGRPLDRMRRARVQARQSFVYAQAARLGVPGEWRPAAAHGLAFMRRNFKRPDGLFRTTVDSSGAPLDEDAYLYDQAFFLMASATMALTVADPAPLEAECSELLAQIERAMSHPSGGFREAGEHTFQANAHMHLLEAAMAWVEAGGDGRWKALAERVVDLALTRFIDAEGGFLREFFDDAWRPADGPNGRLVEPGHQFEWSWLMARWSRMTGSDEAASAARRLFKAGVQGVDLCRSVAVDELDELKAVRSGRARFWPQTEYIKAALILAGQEREAGRADDDYLAHAVRGADGLWAYLNTPVRGLWRDKMREDSTFVDEPAPASSFYHIVGAILAMMPMRDPRP